MSQTKDTIVTLVLIVGSLILMTGLAIRVTFGLFQIPTANEFGWQRLKFFWRSQFRIQPGVLVNCYSVHLRKIW